MCHLSHRLYGSVPTRAGRVVPVLTVRGRLSIVPPIPTRRVAYWVPFGGLTQHKDNLMTYRIPPPPHKRLTLLAAALVALVLALPAAVLAQTACNNSICTVRMAPVNYATVVDGCGAHATPGRMKVIFSSTDSSVTRASFPTAGYLIQGSNTDRTTGNFTDWEWRAAFLNRGRWSEPAANRIGFAGGVLGENIIEVRPKAGARIWSNRQRDNPNQGPGELVVQVFNLPSGSEYAAAGTAHFLFMGGKGCARVGPGGGLLGGNQ